VEHLRGRRGFAVSSSVPACVVMRPRLLSGSPTR
jgi:hypothetical protein